MPGLYDTPVGALDPRSMALMQMGLGMMGSSGPSQTPVSLGQSLGKAGMQGMQTFQNQTLMNQQLMEAQKQQQAKAEQEAAFGRLAADPRFAGLGDLLRVAPGAAIERAMPKEAANPFGKVDPKDYTPESILKFRQTMNYGDLVRAVPERAPAESDLTRLIRERDALPAGDPNRTLFDDKIKKLTTQQPGTVVNVQPDGLGLKPRDRFDMEGKLRDDFRNNQVVKSADEMGSAFRLIETARNSPSPANDLAMATKYMKILDPTSVVRESELALAMNATGLLDKVRNYSNMLVTGQKLNPNQREDFYKSAKAINEAFQSERNSIAERFRVNASQYNLTPENVIGSPTKRRVYNPKTGKFE
jgi:hypothetical protein